MIGIKKPLEKPEVFLCRLNQFDDGANRVKKS